MMNHGLAWDEFECQEEEDAVNPDLLLALLQKLRGRMYD